MKADVNKRNTTIQEFSDQHDFWNNPLLNAINKGELKKEDYQYLFGQYYFYSKFFIKLIAAGLLVIEDDAQRVELIENLWEESGSNHAEQSHSKLFSNFLTDSLKISSLQSLSMKASTQYFLDNMLNYCLNHSPLEVIAFLAYLCSESSFYPIYFRDVLPGKSESEFFVSPR